MTKLSMLAGWVGAVLAALAGGGSACSKAKTYSYFDVHVTIDPTTVTTTRLALITNCELQILGTGVDETKILGCRENQVRYDVGRFEWTTDTEAGNVRFIVRVFDASMVLIGEGTTAMLPISPGKRTPIELPVVGVSTTQPDGGGSDAPGDGGVADTSSPTDGSTITDANTPDGGTADAAAADAG